MDSLLPPPDPQVPNLLEHRKQEKRTDNLITWGRRVFIGVLTIAVVSLLAIAYQNRDLGELAERQRQQFINCKDVPASTPGCDEPVVSERDVEKAKDGSNGLPGLPGAEGPRGPRGLTGPPASFRQVVDAVNAVIAQALVANCSGTCKGATGGKGEPGDSIKGDTGSTGATGATGEKGDKGDTGEKGEKGDPGEAGPNCPEGTTLQPKTVLTPENPLVGEQIMACA